MMGLKVFATNVPDMYGLKALAHDRLHTIDAPVTYAGMHHIHRDCVPYWNEPDPQLFVDAVSEQPTLRNLQGVTAVRNAYSWENCASMLEEAIASARQ